MQGMHIFPWIMFHNTMKSNHIVHEFHSLEWQLCKVILIILFLIDLSIFFNPQAEL